MDKLYLSRSIRARAREIMKTLKVSAITVRFESSEFSDKFSQLLEDIKQELEILPECFHFEQGGFEHSTYPVVSMLNVCFVQTEDGNFLSTNCNDVVVSDAYFFSIFPIDDHLFLLNEIFGEDI